MRRTLLAWPLAAGLACAAGQTPSPGAAGLMDPLVEAAPRPEPAPVPRAAPSLPPSPPPEPGPVVEPGPPPPADDCISDESVAKAKRVQKHVAKYAAKYEVRPGLVNGLIWVESKFNPKARGPAGAQGLMQIMPKTSRSLAKKIGRKNKPYDPSYSVEAGTYYIGRMLHKFDGDEALALAAYNRGAGKVKTWQAEDTPMPEGTKAFVDKVQSAARCLEHRLGSKPVG